MRRFLMIPLALAACANGPTPPGGTKEWALPAEGVRILKIVAIDGQLEVRTEERASLGIRVTCSDPDSVDAERGDGDAEIRVPAAAGPVSLVVAAPPGLDLRILAGGASVSVRGTWGRADLATRDGAIRVDADLAGGSVRTVAGDVDAACRRADLPADLEIRSDSGNLALRLSAAFHGGVQVGGAKGGITIVPHKRQSRMVWDPDETNVKGWIGPVPSAADIESPEWKDRPSVLLRTKAGTARFELFD